MSTRLLIRDNRNIFTGFNGASNLDITKSSPTGLDFGATTDFSVSIWMRTQQRAAGRTALGRRDGTGAANVGWLMGPSGGGRLFFELSDGTTEASPVTTSGPIMNDGLWHLCIGTFDRDGLGSTYVDGVAGATASIAGVGDITTAATANLRAGRDGGGNNRYQGELGTMRIWSGKILTASEILDFYQRGVVPQASSQVLIWSADNMAGLTAYDSSGQGNDGTIVSGIYAQRGGPFFPRGVAGGNMLYNGNFEHYPALTTATTTDSRWADASAGGSTNTNGFGWATLIGGTAEVSFDTDDSYPGERVLRLSTKAVASNALASHVRSPTTAANIVAQAIPVLPSTSYTVTYRMRTVYVSGDSNDGATLRLQEYTGAGASVTSTDGTKVKTSTEWTDYTFSITTGATTRFLRVEPRVVGNSGTATLIMDGRYKKISVNLTTPTVRSAPSIQRLMVRDFGTGLYSASSSAKVVTSPTTAFEVDSLNAAGLTAMVWIKYRDATGQVFLRFNSQDDTLDCLRLNIESATRRLFVWSVDTSGTGAVVIKPTTTIRPDRWNQVAFTFLYDSVGLTGTSEVFLNGLSIGSGTRAAYAQRQSGNVKLAGTNNPQTFDDLMVYNRVLTAAEIADIYYRNVVDDDSLKLRWKFDEGSGSNAVDSSGNGNTGAITAFTYTSNVPMYARTAV